MSEFQVAEKKFPITHELRTWASDCEAAITYLTEDPGDPQHSIRPITIDLNTGTGSKCQEQCGMSFGDKGNTNQEITFILSTHTNELTALHLVQVIREHYLKHEAAFAGKQINVIFGGDPSRAKALLTVLKDTAITEMTEGEYETYRNTAYQVNCNRVDISQLPRPALDDEQEQTAWRRALEQLISGTHLGKHATEKEKHWYHALKSYYEQLESTPGTSGWLLQKHLALQRYTNKIDLHTTSRAGSPIALIFGPEDPLNETTLQTLALMGATHIIPGTSDGKYIDLTTPLHPYARHGLLLECGAHRDIVRSSAVAERAFFGAVLDKFGLHLTKEPGSPQQATMILSQGMKRIYPPLSPNAPRMASDALNLIPEFYLQSEKISPNDERVQKGHWGAGGETEARFYALSANDPLPPSVQALVKQDKLPTHNNGDAIHRGDLAFWSTYTLADGTIIPVLFRSPFNGLTFMTPAKGWDRIDGPYYFTEVSTENKEVTVHLKENEPLKHQEEAANDQLHSSNARKIWTERISRNDATREQTKAGLPGMREYLKR
jgi:hypothetical protein